MGFFDKLFRSSELKSTGDKPQVGFNLSDLVEIDLPSIPDEKFVMLDEDENSDGQKFTNYEYNSATPFAGLFTSITVKYFDETTKNIILSRPISQKVNVKKINSFLIDLMRLYGKDQDGRTILTDNESSKINSSNFRVLISRYWSIMKPPVQAIMLDYTDFGEENDEDEGLKLVIHWSTKQVK